MSYNGNEPPEDNDLAALDTLNRDLRVGIGLAESRVQRLMGEIFSSPQTAERGMRTLIKRGGLEHALAVLEKDSFARSWHFGGLRSGPLRPWRQRAVNTALKELPEALRELQHLLDRRRDVMAARGRMLQHPPTWDPDDEPPRPRGRPRSRGRS